MPYFLLRWSEEHQGLAPAKWFPLSLRIHHIKRSDAGGDLHDHPWWWGSIILRGGYKEMYRDRDGHLHMRSRGAGSFAIHSTRFRHRLIVSSSEGATSLFFHGPRIKLWGFHTRRGFVPWTQYNEEA